MHAQDTWIYVYSKHLWLICDTCMRHVDLNMRRACVWTRVCHENNAILKWGRMGMMPFLGKGVNGNDVFLEVGL